MMGYGWGVGYGWIFMLAFWILLLGTVIWVATWVVPGPRRGEGAARPPLESPLEILQRRLANGEIDTEEYLRLRTTLSHTPTAELRDGE